MGGELLGIMSTLGIGDGYLITNARDDEMDGDAQAIIFGGIIFGVEFDYSRGKDTRFIYSLNINGGKSFGLPGMVTMPVRTNTTGDLNPVNWTVPK